MTKSKLLRSLLFITGLGLMVATIPIFFPANLMAYFHQLLGLGEFPDRPITLYLARSTSLLYAVHGFVMTYTAWNFTKMRPLVPVLGWLHVIVGLTMFGIDWTSGMPLYWTVGEGPGVAAMGAIIVWLSNSAEDVAKT